MRTRQGEPICREHVMAHAIAADLHTQAVEGWGQDEGNGQGHGQRQWHKLCVVL